MIIISLILGIILGAFTVIFALQNVAVVSVVFFNWQMTGSMAIVLVFAVLLGVIICALFSIPEVIDTKAKLKSLKKQNIDLAEQLRNKTTTTTY